MRHLHLDPLGGIAGDMFAAALLHAEPALEAPVQRAVAAVAGVPCRLLAHRDATLAGVRFAVEAGHGHHHTRWREIRDRLDAAPLAAAARGHAIGIFTRLAEAEARVHGIDPAEVTFHEVGAADSIADIVAAALLIAAQEEADGAATWSCAALPLGGGRVRTAHGMLPVPAPATALLLEGFVTIDDGVAGERVTPTGAAILRHLAADAPPPPGPRRVLRSGIGFGSRVLPGLSNVLRVLVSAPDAAAAPLPAPALEHGRRELAVISFEVDDQSPEDLAAGIARIRAVAGVHDVLQMPAFAKKGRMAAHLQVLAAPEAVEAAVGACFGETSTIGLRIASVQGRTLHRRVAEVSVAGRAVRVKRVARPGGATGKAEADDLGDVAGHAARTRLRRAAEDLADE